MRLKIINEITEGEHGQFSRPRVVDAVTGEMVEGVLAVQVELNSQGCQAKLYVIPEADIEVINPEIVEVVNEDS
jgi:hypothetical protein